METYIALVSRCPSVSDGAKVTLFELLLHFGNGRLPSLNEMKRIRNTSKATIQNHLAELVNAGVLKKEQGEGNRALYEVSMKRLLELNGLKNEDQVTKWISTFAAVEPNSPKIIKSVLRDPSKWTPNDVLNYYKMYLKRKGEQWNPSAQQYSKMYAQARRMLVQFGGSNMHKMIDFFASNHNRMNQNFSLNSLFVLQSQIYLKSGAKK